MHWGMTRECGSPEDLSQKRSIPTLQSPDSCRFFRSPSPLLIVNLRLSLAPFHNEVLSVSDILEDFRVESHKSVTAGARFLF